MSKVKTETFDTTIRVDRSVKPIYPDWAEKVVHPELELAGPTEYDLSEVEQWLQDNQKHGSVSGHTIYEHLLEGAGFANYLNLQDGLAIQEKGIAVFRRLFASKAVFLWGSIVRSHDGKLFVPFLVESGGRVVVSWHWLSDKWYYLNPALRFKPKK